MTRIVLILAGLVFAVYGYPQVENIWITETYQGKEIRSIIEFLASDDLNGRDTPSEGLDKAADYITGFFKSNNIEHFPGMEGYFQEIKMIKRSRPEMVSIKLGKHEWSSSENMFHLSGIRENVTGFFYLMDSSSQDLSYVDVKGKVVVRLLKTDHNENGMNIMQSSRQLETMLSVAGAAGLIEIFQSGHPLWSNFQNIFSRIGEGSSLKLGNDAAFTHVIYYDFNNTLNTLLSSSLNEKLTIEARGINSNEMTSRNVVGFVKGTDPDLQSEFVVCCAHYDHVGIGKPDASGDSIYNGARDNAVGVMNVLMAAKNAARFPPRRPILFVLFTGEEKGLLGSKWFVENPPVPLDNIIFCLNTDGGGYNDTTLATVIGKLRVKTMGIFDQAAETFDLSAFEGTEQVQFLFNNSDNISFSRKGIPSVSYSPGFRDFDADLQKHFHQPSDEAGTLNYDYLMKYALSFGLSLRLIADSNTRLFWREGDEFYEDGIRLYRR